MNLFESYKMFKRAADGGSMDGRMYLGVCYRLGLGVEKDYEEA